MQTFLPYPDFDESAKVLDRARLGKQRVENMQIMAAIADPTKKGWANHPAVRMWRGHEGALLEYQRAIIVEWLARGYKDTCWAKTQALYGRLVDGTSLMNIGLSMKNPEWLGNEDFHRAHRSNLIRKDPERYGALWPDEPNDLPYIWPVD